MTFEGFDAGRCVKISFLCGIEMWFTDPVTTQTSSTGTCKLVFHLSTRYETVDQIRSNFYHERKEKLHSKNIRTPFNLFDWCICLVIVLLNRCHYHSTTLRKKDFKFLNRRLKEHEGKDWSEHTQTRQSMVFAFTTITKEAI